MTNSWTDIKNADLVLIMGGNAAEAHPCGFKWVTEAMQTRKAKLIVVDPRFTRSAAVADVYAPIRVGTDIAFLGGVINYLLSNNKIHLDYVKMNTDVAFLTKPDYKFDNGFFSGYDEAKRSYNKASWGYQLGEDGFVKVDETLQDPLCVYQQMKKHFARYTPELVSQITGTPKDKFLKIAQMLGETSTPDKVMTICYALGWTQHSVGSQNIRTMAMIQLLLGNMGRPGGGVNACAATPTCRASPTCAPTPRCCRATCSAPTDADVDRATYLAARTGKPLRPGQMAFTQNFPKWHTSLMKAYYGAAATAENNFAYDWMPKRDTGYDVLAIFERMHQGKVNGFIVQGFNPLAAVPNKKKLSQALAKLKYLVVMDPLETETSEFWKNFGPLNDVDPKQIADRGVPLPDQLLCRRDRHLHQLQPRDQLEGEGGRPARRSQARLGDHGAPVREAARHVRQGRRCLPEPMAALAWPYLNANVPHPSEVLREINGKALADVLRSRPTRRTRRRRRAVLVKAGEQLPGFAMLRDDGSTSCGNWIYSGCWSQAGNLTARRDTATRPAWACSRAGASRGRPTGASSTTAPVPTRTASPGIRRRKYLAWNGTSWAGGADVPDMRPDAAPEQGVGAFIMNPEGVARLHAVGMNEGPFPEHYEPFETPVGVNLMCPSNPKAVSNPAARVYKGDLEAFGKKEEFPYAATTYRLTEHLHFWTKHSRSNAIVQPAPFVEIGEELAKEKGIKQGDKVKVRSNRGEVIAACVVTKRIKGAGRATARRCTTWASPSTGASRA